MNFEKYQPSIEETNKEEEVVVEEQKKLSESEEEEQNIVKSEKDVEELQERNPAEPTIKKYPNGSYEILAPEEPYHETMTANGVEVVVNWYDDSSKSYEIYFPQIKFGVEEASEKGVYDQVISVSQRPEVAKQVFDYAVELAQTESNLYDIYKKVEEFAGGLPYELEE